MIRIAITAAVYKVVAATMPLDSVVYKPISPNACPTPLAPCSAL